MDRWEVAVAKHDDKHGSTHRVLLAAGWEPFSVTQHPARAPEVWFRRKVTPVRLLPSEPDPALRREVKPT